MSNQPSDRENVRGSAGITSGGDVAIDNTGQLAIGKYINQFKIENPSGEALVKLIDFLDRKRQESVNAEILNRYTPSALPNYPPQRREFVTENRVEELNQALKYLQNHRILLISGIGGVGKTTLARALIETRPANVPPPFWFDFSKNEDATLGDILEQMASYLKTLDIANFEKEERNAGQRDINRLTGELQKREPVWLVFDNLETILGGQHFLDSGIDSLFTSLQDNTHHAKIIITSRTLPLLRNEESLIDSIDEEKQELKGLKIDFSVDYLVKNGLDTPERKKLEELARSVDGHPLALRFLIERVKQVGVSDTLNDLSVYQKRKGKAAKMLFDKLAGDEKGLLERISVYRKNVPRAAIKQMFTAKTAVDAIENLIDKSLLETDHKGNYWLHPLVREFAYEDLENKREAHRCAGAYYCSLKEKTRENILEATHHMIKAYGSVTDEVVDYLKGTPENPDPFISHIVLDILKEKEITSPRIFELLNEFVSAPDPNVQNLFISEYGSFFDKIWAINPEKSIEVLRRILDHADSSQLRLFSRTVARVAGVSPDEAVKLWKEIIDRGEGDMIVLEYVFNHSTKDTKLGEKAEPVLKYLIGKREPRISLLAKRELERLEILKPQNYMTCEEHLEKLRNLPTDEKKLSYVTSEFILDDVTISWYLVIEILNNIYKGSPEEVAKLLKLLIKTYYDYNTVFQRTPRLIAKLAIEEDLKYLKKFLDEHENNVYIKYAGIRALDLIKAEIGEDKTNDLLKPLYEDTEPVIRVLANIMKAEMNSSYVTKHTKVELMNPLDTVKFLDADLAPTKETYLYFVMKSWAFLKATEGTDPNIILNMLEPFEDMKPPKTFYKIFIDITQNHPTWTLKIATFLSKSKGSESRSHGLWFLCNAAHLAPEAAIKHLDKVMKRIKENELTSQDVIFFMCCLTDIRGEELREKKEAFFKELSNHEDGNVRGFAKLLLNGV